MAFATEQDYYNGLAIVAYYLVARKNEAIALLNKNGFQVAPDATLDAVNKEFLTAMGSGDDFLSQATKAIEAYVDQEGPLDLPDMSQYHNSVGASAAGTVISVATNLISSAQQSNALQAQSNAIIANQQQTVAEIEAIAIQKANAATATAVANADASNRPFPWLYVLIGAAVVIAIVIIKKKRTT